MVETPLDKIKKELEERAQLRTHYIEVEKLGAKKKERTDMRKRNRIVDWLFENFNVKGTDTPGVSIGEIDIKVFMDTITIITHEI